MNPDKARLALIAALLFTALVLLTIAFSTTSHLEGKVEIERYITKKCSHIQYGLYRYCTKQCGKDDDWDCVSIDYDKLEDNSYQFMSPKFSAISFGCVYALALLAFAVFLISLFTNVQESFVTKVLMVHATCGLLGILFGCFYTKALLDFWNSGDIPYYTLISIGRSWSFDINMTACSLMILFPVCAVILLHDFERSH